MLDHSGNPGRHPLADRGDDLYETPAVAVEALLLAEPIPRVVWEPACGPGAISRALLDAGHTVYSSDLRDYGFGLAGLNFLAARELPPGVQAIVTNPPYKDANAFVSTAIALCPLVAMLLRLPFLESEGRRAILEDGGLARVHVFRNRLPMMHRGGWQGNRTGSSMAFAWFVWDRAHRGPATINRISWGPLTGPASRP